MDIITLPTITASDRQSWFDELNQYLVPNYFDSVQYENGTDGTTYASIDADGARVAYYIKDGVRAMAIDTGYAAPATSAPYMHLYVAGALGLGVVIANNSLNQIQYHKATHLIVDDNHLWFGALDLPPAP